jgi:hypothetical protein
MLRLRCEFGGVEVLGGGEKTGRAGWSQPPAGAVVGQVPPVRDNHGPQPLLRPNQPSEIGGVSPSITPLTGKIILAVKPRGYEFFGGVQYRHEHGCRESSAPRTA